MGSDNTIWITLGIVVSILVPISIFAGNQIVKTRRDRKREIENKLKVHFEDIKREVIDHISEMARSIAIRNNRLVTSYAPIGESYPFVKQESYKCFELHFTEEASEWKQLNGKSLQLIANLNKVLEQKKTTTIGQDIKAVVKSLPDDFDEKLRDIQNRYENSEYELNHNLKHLQHNYSEFAAKLDNKIDGISKYGIGKEFQKLKKCPICKKF